MRPRVVEGLSCHDDRLGPGEALGQAAITKQLIRADAARLGHFTCAGQSLTGYEAISRFCCPPHAEQREEGRGAVPEARDWPRRSRRQTGSGRTAPDRPRRASSADPQIWVASEPTPLISMMRKPFAGAEARPWIRSGCRTGRSRSWGSSGAMASIRAVSSRVTSLAPFRKVEPLQWLPTKTSFTPLAGGRHLMQPCGEGGGR